MWTYIFPSLLLGGELKIELPSFTQQERESIGRIASKEILWIRENFVKELKSQLLAAGFDISVIQRYEKEIQAQLEKILSGVNLVFSPAAGMMGKCFEDRVDIYVRSILGASGKDTDFNGEEFRTRLRSTILHETMHGMQPEYDKSRLSFEQKYIYNEGGADAIVSIVTGNAFQETLNTMYALSIMALSHIIFNERNPPTERQALLDDFLTYTVCGSTLGKDAIDSIESRFVEAEKKLVTAGELSPKYKTDIANFAYDLVHNDKLGGESIRFLKAMVRVKDDFLDPTTFLMNRLRKLTEIFRKQEEETPDKGRNFFTSIKQ